MRAQVTSRSSDLLEEVVRPVISTRQLGVIAVIVVLAGVLAAITFNAQRAVGASVPAAVASASGQGLVANDLAKKVDAQLTTSALSYAETRCPDYAPDLSVSPVQTCASMENGKPVMIDVHFTSTKEFTAKVLRAS